MVGVFWTHPDNGVETPHDAVGDTEVVMSRWRLMAMILAFGMLGGACVEDVGGMLVLRSERLQPGECSFEPGEEGDFLARGTLDLALTNRYVLFPTIRNELQEVRQVRIQPQNAGGAQGDFRDVLNESNVVRLESATVSFITPSNVSFAMPQGIKIPVSGSIQPGGLATTALEIVDVTLGGVLQQAPEFAQAGALVTVIAEVSFEGTTSGGTEIESNKFSFPLDLCFRCLVNFVPGTLFPDDDGSLTCGAAAQAGMDVEMNDDVDILDVVTPCNVGQDDPVDCRLCRTLVSDPNAADAICDP